MSEPARLADGKAFHKLIARFYEYEESIDSEWTLTKASGKSGRADLFFWLKRDFSEAVVIETKWTDWEKLHQKGTLRSNLHKHRRQVWSYLDGETWQEKGRIGKPIALSEIVRQAALVYPRTPRGADLQASIEAELGEWGITAVWFDDPPPSGTTGGRAWAALQSGEIQTADLRGSRDWHDYISRLQKPSPITPMQDR